MSEEGKKHANELAARLLELRIQRDRVADALLDAIAVIQSLGGQDNSSDPIPNVTELRAALKGIPPLCSICRSRHGREITHACE